MKLYARMGIYHATCGEHPITDLYYNICDTTVYTNARILIPLIGEYYYYHWQSSEHNCDYS